MQSENARRRGRPPGSRNRGVAYTRNQDELPGAYFAAAASNRKLSPIDMVRNSSPRLRPEPRAPFCSSTYVSIDATCDEGCAFKADGCYVRSGFTAQLARRLDATAAEVTGVRVMQNEAALLDRAFVRLGHVPQDGARGGRDLRLHVGGDVPNERGARILAAAARRWVERGGGRVWTYTHAWQYIARGAWGTISVLASCETPEQARYAMALGYVPAIVVRQFPDRRAFRIAGLDARVVPCPAETSKRTCVECRLCLDDGALRARNVVIAFEAHGGQTGAGAVKARRVLPVLQTEAAVHA